MFQLYYTAIIVILMVIALAKELARPPLIVFSALMLLVFGKVVTIDEAIAGFSNKGMLTVGMLFVVSAGLQSSGGFGNLVTKLLGKEKMKIEQRYFRLLFPVAGFSAFLNNTPIVASLIPMVKSWAKKHDIASSKFLIPISYAAILGGTCTLIGTSTNLIVHGLLIENGFSGLGFFEITKVGLPIAIIMIFFMVMFGKFLLPDRKDVVAKLDESSREFVAEMKVTAEYLHIGKTIEQANLRHLTGLFLFQIQRADQTISPVAPDEKIFEGDRLFFTGLTQTIYDLQKTPGLKVIEDREFDLSNLDSDKVKTFEAVVSSNSPLIGSTVRASYFRDRYQGVILAIHRAGGRINKKVGDIIFEPSDTLFILAKKGFDKKWYHNKDFNLVTSSVDIFEKPRWKGNLSLLILLAMVIAAATNLLPIILAAALAAITMIATKVISFEDAKNSVNLSILLVIACSFGIAKGIENSGLAGNIAGVMVENLGVFGPVGILAGLFFLTSTFTWVITNNAVAAIMFPVTFSIANSMNLDPMPFILILVMGASTCFATPIGYQTNMMVYGTGGYKFSDFLRIGVIMNIFVGIMATAIIFFLFF